MSGRIVVTGGQVVVGNDVLDADIVIEGEQIVALTARGQAGMAVRVIDASGCYVFPGLVDAHTHIKLDTGIYQTADNWEIGTRAAAFGGVTTVLDFANQIPGQPFGDALAARQAEAADAVVDYSFHMVILEPDRDPAQLEADLQGLLDIGLSSIKLFTTYRPNYYVDDATLLHIFRAMPEGMIAMVHCENDSIVTDATRRLVEQGKTGWRFHGRGRPFEAEAEAVKRVTALADLVGARLYVVHCSTMMAADAVAIYRASPQRQVYGETCIQYLLLDDSRYASDKPEHYILQPPLRDIAYVEALRCRVESGLIDVLSTDSCDYSLEQKRVSPDFTKTPGGLPGVETLLPLVYTTFRDRVPLPGLIKLMTENPARLFGLYPRKGTIQPRSDADLVIYDPELRVTIRHKDLHYVAGYSPYEGMEVQGKVRTVLSRGEVIVDTGEFFGKAGRGQFLTCGPSIGLA